MITLRAAMIASTGLAIVVAAMGHPDDPKASVPHPATKARPFRASLEANPGSARSTLGFPSDGVSLMSWLPLSSFPGNPSTGNDCWGYISPSGRQYALMGLSNGTAFVEITDPGNAQIVEVISGPNSLWHDIKVYQDHAYVVSEGGSGIQVMDMSQIDNGVVTQVTQAGSGATHNVAIDTTSGYLYRTGGDGNGLIVYSLLNPANPTQVATWPDKYVHDCQVVTYTDGPYAGRQIAFLCAGYNGGWNETGLTILDVTNKSNIQLVSQMQHSSNNYSHQAWLTEDRHYLYLNDELDEQNTGSLTTTRIIDVQDINNPTQVGTCTTGSTSIDHNLYIKGNHMYQANYRSGLHVFDISSPLNPEHVAHFDTWPSDDGAEFNGLWSCYPFFEDGTVIGSDLESGLFVWQVVEPELEMEVLDPLPSSIDPAGDSIRVRLAAVNEGEVDPDAAFLHVNEGSGWTSHLLQPAAGSFDEYDAVFPPTTCGTQVSYYLSATSTDGFELVLPLGGASSPWTALSANGIDTSFTDTFDTDLGWNVTGSATDGHWDRGIPAGGGDRGDPASAPDGSYCYLTDNVDGNSDVDGGATVLTSPILDGSGEGAMLTYWRWFHNSFGGSPFEDEFTVEISGNGGSSWTVLEVVGPGGGEVSGGWYEVSFDLSNVSGYSPSANTRVRFTAEDSGDGSVVEAGVDDVRISAIICDPPCAADVNGDSQVNVVDLLAIISLWGTNNESADVDNDGVVAVGDLLAVINAWGDC